MEYYQKKLFHNITYEEYKFMLPCLSAIERRFQEGETICTYGKSTKVLGILAGGSASVVRFEINGSRTILEQLGSQDIFGENLAFCGTACETIAVICESDCSVLFIHYDYITSTCAKACPCHHQLIQNMLQIISEKTLLLSERIEVLSKRSIREKLLCYFLQLAGKAGSSRFDLPFSMVDLADYLSIDRSAMTREIKKMKNDRLIDLAQKQVTILTKNDNEPAASH